MRAEVDAATHEPRQLLDISFDFAKSIGLPKFSKDLNVSVWNTKLSCRVFDVVDNGARKHHFFSFTEFEAGENSDVVVSCVWHFLNWWVVNVNRNVWPRALAMHADNSGGQNKNRKMTAFMAWLLVTARVKDVTLDFMIPGHTRFSPDRGFGVLKHCLRGRDLYSVDDVILCVCEEQHEWLGFYIHMRPEQMFAWDSVSSLFLHIRGIRQYHCLRGFAKDSKGKLQVWCAARVRPSTPEVCIALCRQGRRAALQDACHEAFSVQPALIPMRVPTYRADVLRSFLPYMPARSHAAFLPPDIQP